MATAEALMTAESLASGPILAIPRNSCKEGLLACRPPDRRHGYVCLKADRMVGNFVEEHDLGRVMSNDSGVITERDPDTVRGADVAYYSYARLPKGPLPTVYGPEVPELIVEVRSANDPWHEILEKVAEYSAPAYCMVVVLDPEAQTAHLFGPTDPPCTLGPEDELVLPSVLEGFRVRVGWFFE